MHVIVMGFYNWFNIWNSLNSFKRKTKHWKICFIVDDVHIIIMFKHSYHFTAIPVLPDCVIPVECPPKDGEISCTDNGSIDMGDCIVPPKRCRHKDNKPWIWEFDDNTIINKRLPKYNIYYHIFCCNMFVFACSIIAKSQCWLFAIQSNYPYLPSHIRICPHMSVFARVFNFRYLHCGLKDYILCCQSTRKYDA